MEALKAIIIKIIGKQNVTKGFKFMRYPKLAHILVPLKRVLKNVKEIWSFLFELKKSVIFNDQYAVRVTVSVTVSVTVKLNKAGARPELNILILLNWN